MKESINQRLQELRAELESGRSMLADLEEQKAVLKNTMLRISGAIQVLEELLAKENSGYCESDVSGTEIPCQGIAA
jgi:hypothetical protein